MKNFAVRIRNINTTIKIFLICFAVYFVCNAHMK